MHTVVDTLFYAYFDFFLIIFLNAQITTIKIVKKLRYTYNFCQI